MARKSWSEKLRGAGPAHVETLTKAAMGMPIGTRLFIGTPSMVRDYVLAIPLGETRTLADMRAALARQNDADASCPLTSGIFARIVAEAALDEHRAGAPLSSVAPFWRLVDPNSPLARKLSCGPELVVQMRAAESVQ